MIRNYLLIALRSFKKNKSYSFLNVFGLTVGISCAIIIFLYAYDELTYDHNHVRRDVIYRLNCTYFLPNNGGAEEMAMGGPVVAQMLVKDFPEIKQSVRIYPMTNSVIEMPGTDERVYQNLFAADSNLFQLFTFPFLSGNPTTALKEPMSIVLSETMARKYFNKTNVVGETLYFPEDSASFKVTGVIQDYPQNTHLRMDMIISFETLRAFHYSLETWWSFGYYNYVEVAPGADLKALNEKIRFISRDYIADQEDGSGYHQEYALVPLSSIHLYSNLRGEIEPNSRAAYVYLFLLIGIFILAIACINFMNLATARSAMRAKEIGLRKVSGAYREQLIGQFLSESVLLAFMAMILSIGLIYVMVPYVNDFTGKRLTLFGNTIALQALFGITVFVGLLAGSYPAFFLSDFKPVETLKGNFKTGTKGNVLRKSLVVFQFTISIFLISGTLIVLNHLSYLRSMDLGFTKDHIVTIPTHNVTNARQEFTLLKNELEGVAGITGVTLTSQVPGVEMNNNVVRIGWDEDAAWSDMRFLAVDEDFARVYNLEMVTGRFFSKEFPSDETQAFVLNESGVERLGWNSPEEAIGQPLKWQDRKGRVVGVVKDFHFMSANVAIEPFIMIMHKKWSVGYLSAKVSGQNLSQSLDQIRSVFVKTLSNRIFEYSFLDQSFDKQYKSEDKFVGIFTFFAGVAILIACLGLYGLAMFTAEIKFKEIGIRKVLGASTSSLIILLVREFSLLVTIAFIIAVPISYYGMSRWLSTFPYREDINPRLFLQAGVVSIVIAMLTVSYQSMKAARINPVDSLANQ